METLLFEERQYFRQWYIWIPLLGIDALLLWGAIQQLVFEKPFGDHPAGNVELILLLIFMALLNGFFALLQLRTEITRDSIRIAFIPILRQEYHWEDIAEATVRTYKPILEFGGWGLRFGAGGRAYSVSGKIGLDLRLKNGKRVLIGTQRPDDLNLLLHNRKQKG